MNVYGQGENNVWCFGNKYGINFNSGSPVLFLNNMTTLEGCASVCDANGNLLFYASPEQVWDKNDNLMPNGNGLSGNQSSTQGAAIVRSFSNPNQYYLFTISGYENMYRRAYYSVIDMTLNSGNGDVIVGQKNILFDSNMIEKMIVIKGGDCHSNWLVLHHQSDSIFHAYKIDINGINTVPVVSNSGFYHSPDAYAVGEMQVSPVTNNIAVFNFHLNLFNSLTGIELHSFDINTGIVSNAINLDTMQSSGYYGGCYSPDGSKLYVNDKMGANAAIYQYDVSLLPNVQAVINSRINVGQAVGGGIRRGPDNKIYFTHLDSIGAITNPNAVGLACNVVYSVVGMLAYPAEPGQGFGNMYVNNFPEYTFNKKDTAICFGLNTVIVSAPAGYTSYIWSDSTTSQMDTFLNPGTKWVTSFLNCTARVDTFKVTAATIDTSSHITDTNLCFVNNVPVVSAPMGYGAYLWSDGFTIQQDTFSHPGVKWVYAQTACNMLVDTIIVHQGFDTTKTSMDTTHCVAYSPIPITAPGGYTSYLWNDGKTTQADTFFNTTTKWVTALNGCNMLIDTIHFTATTIPQDSLFAHENDTAICFEAGAVNVSAPGGYTFYLWNDGVTTQSNVFNNAGTKWVYAQKLCTLLIDTFAIQSQPTDTLTGSIDTMICFSNGTTLSAVSGYDTYLWSDGNTGITDTFSNTAVKRVYAHKACAERIDTVSVQFINDLAVDLGPDTAICKGESVQLDATSPYNTALYLWQDGKTNAIYNVTEGGDYSVRVSVGPCNVSDTIRVHQKVIDIKLKDGLIPCHEESVTLDAGVDSAGYLWQDGSTNRTYKATKEGSYSIKVSKDNCSATASVTVRFEGCPCNVVIPTAFSPNGDSRNDKFGLTVNCQVMSFRLMVYNRWGNRVFYSEDINQKWDGTVKGIAVDGDVYNYYMEFKDGDNKSYSYKGDVTLVR